MNPLDFPKLTKHVSDFSGVLTSAQVESFSEQLAEHERNTTEEVVVVFFPHREGHELIDIGLKVFNENGIGQKNLNNGLLLIVATEEKKLRIVTGKGMEIKYSEMRCRDIIENHLRPLLNDGKYLEMIGRWGEIVRDPSYVAVIHRKTGIATICGGSILVGILYLIEKYIGWHTIGNSLFGNEDLFVYIEFFVFILGILLLIITSISDKILRYTGLSLLLIATLIGLIPFGTSSKCTKVAPPGNILITTTCSRTVYGTVFTSSKDEYTEYYRITHPEQFRSSSSSSDSDGGGYSSSYGGGGGSSNGGGYGD